MKTYATKLYYAVVAIVAILLATPSAEAQYKYTFRDSLGTYKVTFTPHKTASVRIAPPSQKPINAHTYEVRLGAAFAAATGTGHGWTPGAGMSTLYYNSESKPIGWQREPRWFTLNGDFGYWAQEWFYVGASLTWTGGFSGVYRDDTHERTGMQTHHICSIMPTVRFAWLRRGIVQLYSGVGLGIGLAVEESNPLPTCTTRVSPTVAYDLTFVGIAVGRKVFGYIDFGIGTRGAVSAGIGCRFESKR